MRLWQLPPHDHCKRCADYEKGMARLTQLLPAVLSKVGDAEHEEHAKVCERAGGEAEAWIEVRKLQAAIPDLKKHVEWRDAQRKYLKTVEMNLEPHEVLLQLDYGGLTDSANNKISVWSVTALAADREQENFDFFFDAASKKKSETGTAKKNGRTGKFFLGELLDPVSGKDGVSLLRQRYPLATKVYLSGDTGNGYRAYEMLEELSELFEKYWLHVLLVPLAPGHAYNRTDARIAHINAFIKKIKRSGRFFGAENLPRLLHAAAEAGASNRKFMARSNIFFRKVPAETEADDIKKKNYGAQLIHKSLDKGHMGVHGLLYFDFSFETPNGVTQPVGYARAREHGDPNKAGNLTFVYTWRKDYARLICQPCSDFKVKAFTM